MKKALIYIITLACSLQIHGQCNTEQHSVNRQDSWDSCSTSPLPDNSEENGHWILYDLGFEYDIVSTDIWNYNVEGATDIGIQVFEIRHSLDQLNWTSAGEFSLSEASGDNSYSGESIAFTPFSARYVLLIANQNFGGNCSGLSQVRFNLGELTSTEPTEFDQFQQFGLTVFPNPSNGLFRVDLGELNPDRFEIQNIIGQVISSSEFVDQEFLLVNLKKRPSGTYFLRLIDGESTYSVKLLLK